MESRVWRRPSSPTLTWGHTFRKPALREASDYSLCPYRGRQAAAAAFGAVERLRDDYIPAAFSGVPATVLVGGLSAEFLDFNGVVATYTPISFGLILAVSFILLLIVFRSIVIPVKAIIMNLLSVGTAYGLMVLVFQKGIGANLFGFQQTETIDVWIPLVLFAVFFGLSMDYHVFMLSRIRERFDKRRTTPSPWPMGSVRRQA